MDNGQFKKRDILERTFKFGVRVVRFVAILPKTPAGYALANQVVRSSTSIGANLEEAQDALSKRDFVHIMTISLKESRETYYWLKVLRESELVTSKEIDSLLQENLEIVKILTTIVKKSKTS